ncbi:hypothetical protein [Burkholderia pseudomallei]|uniref:hypothetical protein n=2 Tax=Burkholderia pseudomallei TaxID=28450 RepID=UPI00105EC409|nr:hypothetical protein [Burkholderia pseudomallei]
MTLNHDAGNPTKSEGKIHTFDSNRSSWKFNYSSIPLYECARNSCQLEGPAKAALEKDFVKIIEAYSGAQNFIAKGDRDYNYAVVRVPVKCPCDQKHTATFYARLQGDTGGPKHDGDFLLADVSGAKLEDTLDGLASKDDAMDLLEKLAIRWNLVADQILITSPFVGAKYASSTQQLAIWEWLFSVLDIEKCVFLTRGTTWTAYKSSLKEDRAPDNLLDKFGLENKLVAMDVRTRNVHANFFAGLSDTRCEILSTSANLLRGPSVENIGFRALDRSSFDKRYLQRLELERPLPAAAKVKAHWVLIDQGPKGWRSQPMVDSPYLGGPKPKVPRQIGPPIGPGHQISISAAKQIRDNAVDFLNEGLELLFSDELSSATAKVAVIAIQTAIELLAKYRLVRDAGLQSIIRGDLPGIDLERTVKDGNFSTRGFGEILDLVEEIEYLRDDERDLINQLVNLRNDLVHFSSEVVPQEVTIYCAHVLARVLSVFALGEDRDVGEMEDYRRFLSEPNFQRLVNFAPYRAECVDAAYEALAGEKTLKCYLCDNESFCLRTSQSYFCHCCGFGIGNEAIAFADCSECGSESSVFYDPLNTTNTMHHGKCMNCQVTQWV